MEWVPRRLPPTVLSSLYSSLSFPKNNEGRAELRDAYGEIYGLGRWKTSIGDGQISPATDSPKVIVQWLFQVQREC